jgi:hypothetical protein
MTVTREMLSAFVDDELSRDERERIEAALATDPTMRGYVEQQRQLKKGLSQAFAPILEEPVPRSLTAKLLADTAMPRRDAPLFARLVAAITERTTLMWLAPAGAVAAALVVAVMIGFSPPETLIVTADSELQASPRLASALNEQLAADDEAAKDSWIHIGLSFAALDGDICRTFSGDDPERGGVAGIACRGPDTWRITMLANAEAPSDPNLYRPAGSAMPPIIREAVGDMISGEPFDAAAEQRAKSNGWRN